MLRPRRTLHNDQSGAVAIIFALMAVMLLSVAALGTDIGNEVSRRTVTQTRADFGAFAAAEQMTSTAAAGSPVSAAVRDAVAASMNQNQPEDDNRPCWTKHNCITSDMLKDSDLTNGQVRYTSAGLEVTAPSNYVAFGMAGIMGFQGANVGATATVNVFSPGVRVLPLFAVQGCDYGSQTLADPANGQDTPVVPTLAYDTDTNGTGLSSLTLLDSTGATVTTLTPNSTGNQLQILGSKWTSTTKIGFFRSDTIDPTLVQTQPVFWLQGDATKKSLAPYSKASSSTIQLNIPNAVTASQTVWYVRVFNADTKSPDKNT